MNRNLVLDRLAAALGVPLLLFLFLPLTVYALNRGSVDVPKAVLVEVGLLACVASTLVLGALIGLPVVGRGVAVGLEAAALALFVLVLLPNRTGELAGFDSDLARVANLLPTLKLAVLLVAAFAWLRLRPAQFRMVLHLVLTAALIGSLLIVLVSNSRGEAFRRPGARQLEELLALGKERNVVVLLLDSFTGYRMVEILNERPEIRAALDGFTLYPRAIASALNTPAGSSAILTGDLRFAIETEDETTRNELSLAHSFLAEAQRRGLDTTYLSILDAGNTTLPAADEAALLPGTPLPLLAQTRIYLQFAAISTARVLPAFVFHSVVRLAERFQRLDGQGEQVDDDPLIQATNIPERRSLGGKLAFDRFVGRLHVGSQGTKVIFLHSLLSHAPWNFTEDGQFVVGAGWRSSSIYAARAVVRMVERIRELGLLDDSLLIVTSDHGTLPVADRTMGGLFGADDQLPLGFNPLVMVKPRHATQPLRISDMTVWLGDVAATVRDDLKLPALQGSRYATRSLLAPEDPNRVLELPVFFRPEQESYHEALQHWTRIDARGSFVQFGAATSDSPSRLLTRPSRIVLRSGEDRRATQEVASGLKSGQGTQYGAWIEIDGQVVTRVKDSGVAVLSDAGGRFEVRRFKSAERGLTIAEATPQPTNVFAVAVNVKRKELSKRLRRTLARGAPAEGIHCVLVASSRSRPPSVSQCGAGDLAVEVEWP